MYFNQFFKTIFISFIIFNNSFADGLFSSKNNESFLKVNEAFKVNVKNISKKSFFLNFEVAEDYYLYKKKIKIFINNKDASKVKFPESKIKEDEFFGVSDIYDKNFSIEVFHNKLNVEKIDVEFQGCAERGLCYPPTKINVFNIGNNFLNQDIELKESKSEKIYGKLLSNNIFINLLLFIGFGLLLSFTPCVLPMVPILSGLILKVNKEKNNKPFLLSLSYVSGLCIVYLFVGLFIGYSANVYNIQSAFQDPVYLIIFSILLVVLALSMFGFYEIKIFNILQNLISRYSSNLNISGYSGSFVMGLISALIVGPCVAPPLAGIFIYITAENPGFIITGLLFLSLSIGMSIPLLAYGTFIGKFVPKTGKWMKYINYFIGILLLFVALTFIDRITPIFNLNYQESNLTFKKVENVSELKRLLINKSGKIALVDVYADWCVECKLMEQKTFQDSKVEVILKNLRLIKIDVTKNNKKDIGLLKYLNVMGPPAYIFFDGEGNEIKGYRIQGYMGPEEFHKHLEELDIY
tara:strand:- start:2651 stop:4216 length:1566 start_codon:yes stop_codon:yes gene_type:complete